MNYSYSNKWALCLGLAMGLCLSSSFVIGEEGAKGKQAEAKTEKKGDSNGHAPQSNAFTRFWIHTVGAPMARGMKDGMRKIKKGFTSIGGGGGDSPKTVTRKIDRTKWAKEGDKDYPNLRTKGTSELSDYPGLKAAYKFLRKEGESKTEAKK